MLLASATISAVAPSVRSSHNLTKEPVDSASTVTPGLEVPMPNLPLLATMSRLNYEFGIPFQVCNSKIFILT